jgi:glycosyltransferase involved in cell wall biosynthesis
MKIFLDGRIDYNTGIYTYITSLKENLNLLDGDLDIQIVKDRLDFIKTKSKKIHAIATLIYENYVMSYELNSLKCDIYHCTKNFGIPSRAQFPVVTTLHDLIPLVLRREYSKLFYQHKYFEYYLSKAIKFSNALICISKFTRDEFFRIYPEYKNKIYCISQGIDKNYGRNVTKSKAAAILERFCINKDYVLVMGGAEPRKNVAMFLKIFDENPDLIPYDIVMVGGNWSNHKALVSKLRSREFHSLKNISQDELVAVYKMSTAFVFPSIYEGFGLPVLEAMACGTPVLAHSGASIPEVAGNAAMLVDMRNPEECLRGLKKLLSDRSLREHYIAAGRERIKLFSWEKTASETLEVYKSVV